jgi:hypothetical protein
VTVVQACRCRSQTSESGRNLLNMSVVTAARLALRVHTIKLHLPISCSAAAAARHRASAYSLRASSAAPRSLRTLKDVRLRQRPTMSGAGPASSDVVGAKRLIWPDNARTLTRPLMHEIDGYPRGGVT